MRKKSILFITIFFILFICNGLKLKSKTEQYQNWVNRISSQILSVINKNDINLRYDFKVDFYVIENEQPNAFATFDSDKLRYAVLITTGLIEKIVDNRDDRLAFIISHELAHIMCKHVDRLYFGQNRGEKSIIQLAFSRDDEIEADLEGLRLCAKAGFSPQGAVETLKIFRKVFNDYSTIEANSIGHPPFSERLQYLDRNKERIWRAMTSFTTGVMLLNLHQYDAAIVCFEKVIEEYPNCYEALNNLGYAYLVKYLENFELDDLKKFNVGLIIFGGYYRTASTLEQEIRGIDETLYWTAVNYFNKALSLANDSALINANLGTAYLFDPRQKIESYKLARKHFSEALRQINTEKTLDDMQKAVILINASNIEIVEDNFEKAILLLVNAKKYINSNITLNKNTNLRIFKPIQTSIHNQEYLSNVIKFNQYLVNTRRFQRINDIDEIHNFILDYLRFINKSSLWWDYIYNIYINLCEKKKIKPLNANEIASSKSIIPPRSIKLNYNLSIYISEKISDVEKKLRYSDRIPIVRERKFYRYLYNDYGIEIIGGNTVVAILVRFNKNLKNLEIPNVDMQEINNYIQINDIKLREMLDAKDYFFYYFRTDKDLEYIYCYDLGLGFVIENNKSVGIIIVEPPSVF